MSRPISEFFHEIVKKPGIYKAVERAGWSSGNISSWRKGRYQPTLACVEDVLQVMGYEITVTRKRYDTTVS